MEEQVIEKESTTEERAERIVEVEERLQQQHRNDRHEDTTPSNTTTIDLSTDHITHAPVISVDDSGRGCTFTCLIEGEEQDFSLNWPSDTTAAEEPLVRLCRHLGVPITRIGDIDEIPIVEISGRHYLYIPHPHRKQRMELVLPTGHQLSGEYIRLRDRIRYRVGNVAVKAANLPLFSLRPKGGYRCDEVNVNSQTAVKLLAALSILTVVPVVVLSSIVVYPVLALLFTVMLGLLSGMVYSLIGMLFAAIFLSGLEIDFVR